MTQCQARECEQDGITAIANRTGGNGGLITTIWQDEADAPKKAMRYCGEHGVMLAASLTALTDRDLLVKTEVSRAKE